ncbi:MAG: septal ring lytic transglycosylase RlpA family protein [Burkholderiales bacterium]|nr:septal ring lytic transglycosylase RlpA family protein [Burkholderiales bacterium]
MIDALQREGLQPRRLSALGLALLLAGCATQAPIARHPAPIQTVPTEAPKPAQPAPLPAAKPSQVPQQYGGFYSDDGPIMEVPYDLDALPEPVPHIEPLNRFANKPYSVLGQNYAPTSQFMPFTQQGIASWYGRKFHGKNTASGETYDMFKLTAAHTTLPIPSYARVTNLENGKSVIVRINDRGPFLKSRVMDMSYAAAYRLGYNNKGSARVQIDAIIPGSEKGPGAPALPDVAGMATADPLRAFADRPDESPSDLIPSPAEMAPEPAPVLTPVTVPTIGTKEGVWLQVAAFGSRPAADAFRAKLAAEWNNPSAQPAVQNGGNIWRVRIGPFATLAEANQVASQLGAAYSVRPLVVH